MKTFLSLLLGGLLFCSSANGQGVSSTGGTPQVYGGCTLASATNMDIAASCVPGQLVTITGTTTIASLGSTAAVGTGYRLYFTGALTITSGASLLLPLSTSLITVATTMLDCVVPVTAGNWQCTYPLWSSGYRLTGAGAVISTQGGTFGNINVTGSTQPTSGLYQSASLTPGVTNGLVSGGTKFTISGCSVSSTTGGAAAGTFTIGANTCTVVVTINGATGATAPNGWACSAEDQTALLVLVSQSASTTATASFNIPATAGATDVIRFLCVGY